MDDTAEASKEIPLPFLLKTVAIFLAADGAFKLASIFGRVMPGPLIFGTSDSYYYYCLVAVVDISLAVQIFGRAHYAWIWSLAFFVLRAAVLLTYFVLSSPADGKPAECTRRSRSAWGSSCSGSASGACSFFFGKYSSNTSAWGSGCSGSVSGACSFFFGKYSSNTLGCYFGWGLKSCRNRGE